MSSTLASVGDAGTDRRARPSSWPDHLGEPLGLGQRGRALLAHHVGVVRRRDHLLQPHRQRGQRRPELVRRVDGEVALGGQQVVDPLGRAIQALGHPVKLLHPVPAAERAGIAGAQPVRRSGQLLQRPGQSACLQQAQHHRDADGQQRRARRSAAGR